MNIPPSSPILTDSNKCHVSGPFNCHFRKALRISHEHELHAQHVLRRDGALGGEASRQRYPRLRHDDAERDSLLHRPRPTPRRRAVQGKDQGVVRCWELPCVDHVQASIFVILALRTEWSNWILLRKLKYFKSCLRNLFLLIVGHLSNSIKTTSISGVQSSWTSL